MNSQGVYSYDVLVEGVQIEAVRMEGSYLDCRSFDEVEKRLKTRWVMIRGKITHKPANAGEITRYFTWKPGKPRVRLETSVKDANKELGQEQTTTQPQQIYVPPPRRTYSAYVPPEEPVSFLADVDGLITIKEDDVFDEKVEPYTYKERLSKKQQKAADRAARAAALRTAN